MDTHRLGFLFAIASMPIGCVITTNGDGGTSDPTTPDSASETGGDETGGTTGPTSAGTTEPTTASATDSPDTTAADDDTTGDTTDGEEEDVCRDYANWVVQCDPEERPYTDEIEAECEDAIAYGIREDGVACGEALEELYACLSQLECHSTGDDCDPQFDAAEAACPNLFGGE